MSSLIYIECKPADATCVQCADCEREEADEDGSGASSFYDGPAEMAAHDADYPEHRRLTWLRREVA